MRHSQEDKRPAFGHNAVSRAVGGFPEQQAMI